MPTIAEDRAITRAARQDPDAQPLDDRQLATMTPLRGRPRSASKKVLVSVRYSPEVIDYFKSTGAGWQSLMDSVLRRYVARHARTSRPTSGPHGTA